MVFIAYADPVAISGDALLARQQVCVLLTAFQQQDAAVRLTNHLTELGAFVEHREAQLGVVKVAVAGQDEVGVAGVVDFAQGLLAHALDDGMAQDGLGSIAHLGDHMLFFLVRQADQAGAGCDQRAQVLGREPNSHVPLAAGDDVGLIHDVLYVRQFWPHAR